MLYCSLKAAYARQTMNGVRANGKFRAVLSVSVERAGSQYEYFEIQSRYVVFGEPKLFI